MPCASHNANKGVEVYLHSFLTSAQYADEQSVSKRRE